MRYIKTFEEYSSNSKKVGLFKNKKQSAKKKETEVQKSDPHFLISTATTQEIVKTFDPQNKTALNTNFNQSDI